MASSLPSLVLTPLTRDLAALVGTWFTDEEGPVRLDATFYGSPDLSWWRLVEQTADRHGWIGLMQDECIGSIDVEVDGQRGDFAIYVRPGFRGRGVGRKLLGLVAAEALSLGVEELVGHVESDNVPSIRCLVGAGFSKAGEDEFGPVFELRLRHV